MKTVMAGTMGFGLGGVFGLFMASVRLPPIPIPIPFHIPKSTKPN